MSAAWQFVGARPGGNVHALWAAGRHVRALTAAAVHTSIDGGQTWTTEPMTDIPPPLYAMADSGNTMLVGGVAGAWATRDGGSSWRQVLADATVHALAAANDGSVLAGTESDGILRSEDGGSTWLSANPGLHEADIHALAISPDFERDGTGFAATHSALYRTRSGGRSWREVDLPRAGATVQCIALSPRFADSPVVLVGSEAHGACVSADAGETFSCLDLPTLEGVPAAAISPEGTLAVGAERGVWLSFDAAATWRYVPATHPPLLSLAFVEERLLAGFGRAGGVASFDPQSSTWQPANAGLNGRLVVGLAAAGEQLWTASLDDGVGVSHDGGQSWLPSGLDGSSAAAIASLPGGEVLVATPAGLYTTAPAWQRLPYWEHDGPIVALASSGDAVVAVSVGREAVLWRSADATRTWEPLLRVEGLRALSPAVSPDGRVLVGMLDRVVQGIEWARLPESLGTVTSLSCAPDDPSFVVAGMTLGIARSHDGGRTFAPWTDGLPARPYLAVAATPRTVYALGPGGTLWRRPRSHGQAYSPSTRA